MGAAMTGVNDTVGRVRTRLAAWLVCGPLGHLAGGVVEFAEALVAWARRRGARG